MWYDLTGHQRPAGGWAQIPRHPARRAPSSLAEVGPVIRWPAHLRSVRAFRLWPQEAMEGELPTVGGEKGHRQQEVGKRGAGEDGWGVGTKK